MSNSRSNVKRLAEFRNRAQEHVDGARYDLQHIQDLLETVELPEHVREQVTTALRDVAVAVTDLSNIVVVLCPTPSPRSGVSFDLSGINTDSFGTSGVPGQ